MSLKLSLLVLLVDGDLKLFLCFVIGDIASRRNSILGKPDWIFIAASGIGKLLSILYNLNLKELVIYLWSPKIIY